MVISSQTGDIKVARLKNGELHLMGEVNERLPVITHGLVAHYPFDQTERGISINTNDEVVTPKSNTNTTLTEHGIAIEESTRNLITNGNFSNGLTGWALSGGKGNATIYTTMMGEKTCLYQDVGNWNQTDYRNCSVSVAANTTYTVSFLIYRISGTIVFDPNGPWNTSYSLTPQLKTWVKYTYTFTTGDTGGTEVFHFYANANRAKYYLTDVQLEQKSFSTSFVNGARSGNGSISIPANINSKTQPFTLNFWLALNKDGVIGGYHTNRAILLNNFGSFWRYLPMGSDQRKFIWDYVSSQRVYHDLSSATPFLENQYEMITITWDLSTTKVYRNGAHWGTKNPTADCTLGLIDEIRITNLNASLKDVSIYNRVLSEGEIQKLHKRSFSIESSGNLETPKVIESIIAPSDVTYIPLDFNGESASKEVQPSLESNAVYENGAVWIGAANTNLITMNDTYGEIVNNGGWGGMSSTGSYVEMWNPVGAPKVGKATVRYSGTGGGGTGFGRTGASYINVLPSTTYVASYYVKTANESAFNTNFIYLRQYNSSNTQLSEAGHYLSKQREHVGDGWHRIWAIFTTGANTAKIILDHYAYDTTSSYEIYICGGQLEKTNYVTPFMHGSREYSRLNYKGTDLTTTSWQEFTLSFWVKYVANTGWRLSGAWDRFYFGPNGSNVLNFSWRGLNGAGDTTPKQHNVAGGTVPVGSWTMISCSVKNNEFIDLHINGVSTLNWKNPFQLSSSSMDFGLNGMSPTDVSYPQNAWIKNLIFANRAMTPEEISAIYKTHMQAKGESLQIQNLIKENGI